MSSNDTEVIDWIRAAASRVPVETSLEAMCDDLALLDEPGQGVDPLMLGETERSSTRRVRRRIPTVVALAAAAVVVVGLGMRARNPSVDTIATPGGPAEQPGGPLLPIEDQGPAAVVVPPYITDAPPDGFELGSTRSAGGALPSSSRTSQTYAIAGKQRPDEGDPQLTISWFDVDHEAGLYGDPIQVRGHDGYRLGDAITFEEDGVVVWLWSPTFATEELVDMADSLAIGDDGPSPVTSMPGGLVPLPPRVFHTYEPLAAEVPANGHTATYRAGEQEFTISVEPLSDRGLLHWGFDGHEVMVGDRLVLLNVGEAGEAAINARWTDGEALITALAFDLSEAEVIALIAGSRPAEPSEW